MKNINTKILKGLLNSKLSIKEIDEFRKHYLILDKYTFIRKEYLLDTTKIPLITKSRKDIINFVNKFKNVILALMENNILDDCTIGYDLEYYWEDVYKKALLNIKNPTKAIEIIDTLESNNYREIYFVDNTELEKTFYEKIYKKYSRKEYEIEYYFSDGIKYYLPQYYNDYYPIFFENANIVIIYEEGTFHDENKAYLSSFNFDINSIKFPTSQKEIITSINESEINKFNLMCQHLRNLDKEKEILINKINTLEKLLKIKELKIIHKEDLKNTKEKIKKIENLKELTITQYEKIGYKRELIERSIEHLKEEEWHSSIHID